MTKVQFEGEFEQILTLLREHAFLKYAPSGRLEYQGKIVASYDYFISLIQAATGITLPPNPELAENLDTLRFSRTQEVIRLLSKEALRTAKAQNISFAKVEELSNVYALAVRSLKKLK